jgi:hypothetical protein
MPLWPSRLVWRLKQCIAGYATKVAIEQQWPCICKSWEKQVVRTTPLKDLVGRAAVSQSHQWDADTTHRRTTSRRTGRTSTIPSTIRQLQTHGDVCRGAKFLPLGKSLPHDRIFALADFLGPGCRQTRQQPSARCSWHTNYDR